MQKKIVIHARAVFCRHESFDGRESSFRTPRMERL